MTYAHIDNLDDALRLLEQKDQALEQKNRELEEKAAAVEQQQERLAKLQSQVDWLTRQMFGRKSERLRPADYALFEGTEWLEEARKKPQREPEPEQEEVTYRRKKPSGKRKPLPENLPRVTREYDIPEQEKFCPETGKPSVKWIGTEVSEQLAYEPASCYVIEHVQHTYVRLEENLDGSKPEVVTAKKPQEGLAKCLAAPSLIAAVMTSKFAYHIPLYRLQKMLKACGITTPRSSMCRWIQQGAELLSPLVELMKVSILGSMTMQADDTPVKQQDPGGGKTRTCRFWSYVGDGVTGGHYVVYRYTSDRSRAGPEGFFTDADGHPLFHGNLQCDAAGSFSGLFKAGATWEMTEVACWAHGRRKFHEIRGDFPAKAGWVLKKIKRLYRIERAAKHWNLSPAQVLALRARWSRPVVDEILSWCDDQVAEILPQSKLAEAIGYVRNRGEALRRYLYDGHKHIDNNGCERSLRGIAIGRKNWLFTGSEAGGHAAAVIFSLITSCQLHGVDPHAYLTDVLTRLPQTPEDQLEQFLPDRWAAAQLHANH